MGKVSKWNQLYFPDFSSERSEGPSWGCERSEHPDVCRVLQSASTYSRGLQTAEFSRVQTNLSYCPTGDRIARTTFKAFGHLSQKRAIIGIHWRFGWKGDINGLCLRELLGSWILDQVGKKNHASSITNHHAFSYVCRCFMDQLSDAFEWWRTCRSLGDIVSRLSSNVLDRCDYSSQRYICTTYLCVTGKPTTVWWLYFTL